MVWIAQGRKHVFSAFHGNLIWGNVPYSLANGIHGLIRVVPGQQSLIDSQPLEEYEEPMVEKSIDRGRFGGSSK
jgi:hypothetical protein